MSTKRRAGQPDPRIKKALIRAGLAARKIARMYGTPIYVWENGKVVAKRPY